MMNYPSTFELPTTDKLTGLVTSAYFRHLLREEILPKASSQDDPQPVSVFLLDGDSFKAINDTYGHATGDKVLEGIARVLRETLPETAVISRYGGDEFAAALPDTRVDDAFTLLEEVRRRIAAQQIEGVPEAQMTSSIGLASYPANGRNDVELMSAADQALYNAKITGRNKISLPLADARMITKTSHYSQTQLARLAQLSSALKRTDASLLREALDDLFQKYKDRVATTAKE